MPKKTEKGSRGEWAKAVAEYEERAGRETQEAFARRKHLDVGRFRYWLYKLRGAKNEQPVRFVEVKAGEIAIAGGEVEVTLEAGRCTVRFSGGADAGWIGEVVTALAGRLEC